MKKTYIQPVSKLAEFEEETIIATSGDIEITEEGAQKRSDDVKKFIDFSEDPEW